MLNLFTHLFCYVPCCVLLCAIYAIDANGFTVHASDHYLNVEEALALAFPEAETLHPFAPTLNAAQARAVKAAARSKAHGSLQAVYLAHTGAQFNGIAIIDKVRCRTLMMTFCMAFRADGKIKRIDIMDYPEPQGGAVKGRRYLRRFTGRAHGERLRNGKEIPNIGGASLSCKALVERTRFLLAYQEMVVRAQAQAWVAAQAQTEEKKDVTAQVEKTSPVNERSFILGEPVLRISGTGIDDALMTSVCDLARAWDARINTWNPESELARATTAHVSPLRVTPALARFIDRIYSYHDLSQGLLDPSVAPLVALWQQAEQQQRLPDVAGIAQARTHVGMQPAQWQSAQRQLQLPQHARWDASALAKGWIVQEMATALRTQDVQGVISYGDSSYASIGESLTIGIRDPRPTGQLLGQLTLPADYGFAASGLGMRQFIIDGTAYHHLINPHTGTPLAHHRAAYVIAKDAAEADALASICCLMTDSAEALALVESRAGVEVMLWENNVSTASTGWAAHFTPAPSAPVSASSDTRTQK